MAETQTDPIIVRCKLRDSQTQPLARSKRPQLQRRLESFRKTVEQEFRYLHNHYGERMLAMQDETHAKSLENRQEMMRRRDEHANQIVNDLFEIFSTAASNFVQATQTDCELAVSRRTLDDLKAQVDLERARADMLSEIVIELRAAIRNYEAANVKANKEVRSRHVHCNLQSRHTSSAWLKRKRIL